MAEAAVITSERAGGLEPDSEAALFHRRIEFHVAKRPFNGFGNNSSNGFKLVTLNPNAESHKDSGSSKKCENSLGIYETGLDPEFSFEITFRRIGAGLRNLGNTCFLNSVLQCLTYTEPLAAYLQSGKHQNSCRTSGFCALCAIQKHVSRALQSTGRILEPNDLVSNLRLPIFAFDPYSNFSQWKNFSDIKCLYTFYFAPELESLIKKLGISRNFRIARQEDAHEYMVNLLESMHKCCLPSGIPSESPGAYEKSLVHKIFGGRLRSQVKCMQCSYCSNKFDPFLDLSLEIVKADSLLRALVHFTAKEQLDGGAKQYQCEQCKQKVKALKQLTIHKAPHVLTVHLKRFYSHGPGQKIDKNVAFGPTLDLKPFVTGPYDGDLNYTLYGVLVHAGWSTRSGHYYCFVRTSSGMWYSLDDNRVCQVSERKVLEQKAYMLFYVRDRKNFVPSKPMNVIPKDNTVMNTIGNEVYSKLNRELEEKVLNSTIGKKIDLSSSVALSGRYPLVAGAQKEAPHIKPFQNGNGSHTTGGGSVDVRNLNGIADLVPTSISASVVEDPNASGVKLPESIVPLDSLDKKVLTDFVAKPSVCEKESGRESSCKMDRTNSAALDNKILPMEIVAKGSTEFNHVKSSQKSSIEGESQAGDPSEMIRDSMIEDNHKNGQRMETTLSRSSLSLPAITQNLPGVETKKRRPELKVKRKLFKCHVPTTSFSSNIIFGLGLGVRKKKLKKLRKHRKKNPKQVSGANDINSGPGPSTIDKSPLSLDGSPSEKRNTRCGSKSRKSSVHNVSGEGSSISNDAVNDYFRERIADCSRLSAEKQPQRNLFDVMSMLTRGLEETTVARWDGIDVSLSEKIETRSRGTTAQIGYVGDEWDEEYDRGKRKKLRSSKIDFGGPNLFQEIATKISKRKKAKLNAENQLFRI